MNIFSSPKLLHRFALVIAFFALGFVVYGVWSFKTLNELKVNGQLYQRIAQGKDLIADILPPPKYIIESYLVSLQLSSAREKAEQNDLIERLKALKGEYDTRHEFWLRQVLESQISELLLKQAHAPAAAFYTIAFNELVPAARKNDREAVAAALARMKPLYETHRKVIDQIVPLAGNRIEADEIQAKDRIQSASLLMLAILLVTMGVVIVASTRTLQAVREIANELIESEAKLRTIVDTTMDAVVQIDAHSIITGWDGQAENIFGWSRGEAIGQMLYEMIIPPRDRDAHIQGMKHFLVTGEVPILNKPIEILALRRDGREFPIELTISPIQRKSHHEFCAFIRNITERKDTEREIQRLAYYDVLTGLPNRTLLHDRLGQLIAASHRGHQKFALLFIDLDRFKYVNDSMGHGVGDRLLQAVALYLQECVREGDTVARVGGDEFIVLLREADADDAARVADKLLKMLAEPCDVDGTQISTHASIGISMYPDNADDVDTLIKHADVSMYRAKDMGRNNFQFFTPEMNFHAHHLFSMENDLRLAMERNEFSLQYQPQMDLTNGRICGAEALIRWRHPDKGFISPAVFIPVAEETGQIVPLGEWVLRAACTQLAAWRRQGLPIFPVAVNLSSRQLRTPGLVQRVAAILEETGLRPDDLELEITEGVMMGETQAAMTFLTRMHALGVQLSVDDFGTGYSSLSYLKKMPLDRLKVDQSFVLDIATDANDAAIVRSIIGLGHQFNLRVIAEGVETLEQLDFLRAHGCNEIQGYYFSHPLPADEFVKFINGNPTLRQGHL